MVKGRVYIGDVFINHYVSNPEYRLYMIIGTESTSRDSYYKTLHANGRIASFYASSVRTDLHHERIGHINVKKAVRDLFKDYLQEEVE